MTQTLKIPGLVLTDHVLSVPLDHGRSDGETIEVFARAVAAPDGRDRPFLVYLQGGPGHEAPRPTGRPSSPAWLERALRDFRVLMLDQRGTGRSTPYGGPVTDPGVDLRATRDLPGYKVGVIVRGPLRKPQMTLFSEPSLPQAQIASMLIVGRTAIQEEGGESTVSTQEQGGALLAGQLGKYVGLDDVGLARDQSTGDQSLVLGKYLSPRLYVKIGRAHV